MSQEPTTAVALPESVEQALVNGDLSSLTPAQRVMLYQQTCNSLGLNPLTTPFAYLRLNGKLILYATRNCTDQLRKVHNVDLQIVSREQVGDLYVVTARARMANGRTDEDVAAVSIGGLRGEALANGMMKATTKAKRRVTLSICGLSLLDESEAETIPGARFEPVDVKALPAPTNGHHSEEDATAPPEETSPPGPATYRDDALEADLEQKAPPATETPLTPEQFLAACDRLGIDDTMRRKALGGPVMKYVAQPDHPRTLEEALVVLQRYQADPSWPVPDRLGR